MKNSRQYGKRLRLTSALLILTVLFAGCAPSLPSYAATEADIWKTPDGNVAMTPQAAQEFLTEVRTLRAERDVLLLCRQEEREQTRLLIAEIQGFREQVKMERETSQAVKLELEKELSRQKARARTIGLLSVAGVILSIALR